MMEIISNPLYVSYLTLIVALLTAIRVFVPGGDSSAQSASAPKAAPAAPAAAPAAPVAVTSSEDEEAVVAAITAALSLYAGDGFAIRSIRPAAGGGNLWVSAGRLENTSSL